jgi:hypothetical protein
MMIRRGVTQEDLKNAVIRKHAGGDINGDFGYTRATMKFFLARLWNIGANLLTTLKTPRFGV